MQRVCIDHIDLDELLLEPTKTEWENFVENYTSVNVTHTPRWFNYYVGDRIELHVFSDASEKTYAGVVYIRTIYSSDTIYVNLLSSNTKVDQLKSISLPCLELCGAVRSAHDLIEESRYLDWFDILLVRFYNSPFIVAKAPSTFATFVANRVSRIQENKHISEWHHVRSEDNPADLGSHCGGMGHVGFLWIHLVGTYTIVMPLILS